MSTLVVIFPGVGYHSDKPLLYYSKKLAKEYNYEIVETNYNNLPDKIFGDKNKMKEAFDIAFEQVSKQLDNISWDKYDRKIFISKSIGTALSVVYDKTRGTGAEHILFTPVPQTYDFVRPESGICFAGNNDPWCPIELSISKCEENNIPLMIIDRANHSLETGDVSIDLENMQKIMHEVEKYLE